MGRLGEHNQQASTLSGMLKSAMKWPPRCTMEICADPVFTLAITVMYNFETIQRMRLVVVDVERKDVAATVDPDTCVSCMHTNQTLHKRTSAHASMT